jgi:hypothetical protein
MPYVTVGLASVYSSTYKDILLTDIFMMPTSFTPPLTHRLRAFDKIKGALEEQTPIGTSTSNQLRPQWSHRSA